MFLNSISSKQVYSNIELELKNGNIAQNQNIRVSNILDQHAIKFSIAKFLNTNELTRFFNVSKKYQATLILYPVITKLLFYNQFQKCRNRELLWNYQEDNLIKKKKIQISPIIGIHIKNKADEIKQFNKKFTKRNVEKKSSTTGLLIHGLLAYLIWFYSSKDKVIINKTKIICESIFNSTNCKPLLNYDEGVRNVNDYMRINHFFNTLSLTEEAQIYNLIDYSYSDKELNHFCFITPFILVLTFEKMGNWLPPNSHPIRNYFRVEEKNKVIYALCYSIFLESMVNLVCVWRKHSHMDIRDTSYNGFFLGNLDENLNPKILFVCLENIYFLGCFLYVKRPFLIKKCENIISKKISYIYNKHTPKGIKVFASSTLNKIKNTFRSITSFF